MQERIASLFKRPIDDGDPMVGERFRRENKLFRYVQ